LAVTLLLERGWFYMQTNSSGRLGRVREIGKRIRAGDREGAKAIAQTDHSIYGQAAAAMLDEKLTEAAAVEAIETQRARLERFLPTLSTIITAAPMLGILGTVIGIIRAFNVLSLERNEMDLNMLAGGIAEALITTAGGITVALITLFPYNGLRAQVDRSLSRLETLAAAAMHRQEP